MLNKYYFHLPSIVSRFYPSIKKPETWKCFGFSMSKLVGIILLRVFLK